MLDVPLPKKTLDPLTPSKADEFNSYVGELKDYVTNSGQALNGGITTQLTKAAANYTSTADYYTASGVNFYTATPVAPNLGIANAGSSYVDGMRFRVSIPDTNTGPSTMNINGFGFIDIVKTSGNIALDAGDLLAGLTCELIYNSGNDNFILVHNGSIPYNQFSDGACAFFVRVGSDINIPNALADSIDPIPYADEVHNLNGDFDIVTHIFTAPVKGLYFINASTNVLFTVLSFGGSIFRATQNVRLKINAADFTGADAHSSSDNADNPQDVAVGDTDLTVVLELEKDDELKTTIQALRINAPDVTAIIAAGSYFTGYLIKQLP